jgi:hypothetical protein
MVSAEIYSGEIIYEIPYTLDLNLVYCANEYKAYSAGIKVIGRTLECCKNLT